MYQILEFSLWYGQTESLNCLSVLKDNRMFKFLKMEDSFKETGSVKVVVTGEVTGGGRS
jgi:hypothetical protein